MIELLYATGIRVSELVGLQVDDIDFAAREIKVTGKGDKQRMVPCGDIALHAIVRYLGGRTSGPVFKTVRGKPHTRFSMAHLIRDIWRRSGLTVRASAHSLRHACATHLLSGGANIRVIQEILGHSDVGTTQTYVHVDTARLKQAHTLLGR